MAYVIYCLRRQHVSRTWHSRRRSSKRVIYLRSSWRVVGAENTAVSLIGRFAHSLLHCTAARVRHETWNVERTTKSTLQLVHFASLR